MCHNPDANSQKLVTLSLTRSEHKALNRSKVVLYACNHLKLEDHDKENSLYNESKITRCICIIFGSFVSASLQTSAAPLTPRHPRSQQSDEKKMNKKPLEPFYTWQFCCGGKLKAQRAPEEVKAVFDVGLK